ncbi:1-phosphatidylinositol 4,5-bisphosphate phosphodiesterase delta-4 isoform X2 [Nematostella vectensis]|uniref:1-phosphatidylinositol 4,5-bisphosphate phosphodiesterase delta-4 isoform X2 n=1 Tax=Nematostella vectensis TaxID=45351 RepID=UPI0020775768|nr:1-phosphatidylinositol 4,5-bisphosphate phosphodiesterase delta-4 isoform X2 [Nematostella vectensis]
MGKTTTIGAMPRLVGYKPRKSQNMATGSNSADIEAHECWLHMQKGDDMTKLAGHGKSRKPQLKKFFLDDDRLSITYKPTKKKHIRYEIAQITDVLSGDDVKETLGDLAKKYSLDTCISVKFGADRSLDLVAKSVDTANLWLVGLQTLINNQNTIEKDKVLRQKWLIDAFEKFDKNKDGELGLSEVTKLLNALNVNITPKTIKKRFREANTEGEQAGAEAALNKEEFAEFFKAIATRDEIVEIMNKFASGKAHMNVEDLQKFLYKQGVKEVSKQYCDIIISTYEPTEEGQRDKQLGIDGLTNYLLSKEGDIFDTAHDKVYQDMRQPLSHYFIASSHNTYLMEDQLKGPSSVDAYINAFNKGCRCVELDCWDGDNGDPIVYHGHTLTSKIKFKDIIQAVAEHAFKVSDYPVILSLENHCNIENQRKIAEHLENILGDKLFKDPVDTALTSLPSPESLKGKVLIKGKKLKPEQEMAAVEEDDGTVSDEDEAADIEQEDLAAAREGEVTDGPSTSSASRPAKKKRSNSLRRSFRAVGRAVSKASKSKTAKESKEKKVKLAKELSRCVNYISSVGFKNFEHSKENAKFYQMSSFVESKVATLAQNKAAGFVEYNTRQLSRTYPAGSRVDSSNYNPQVAWNVGCQIVALNYQTDGEYMHLNQGRFRENKRAGYVLKPAYMRNPDIKFNPNNPKSCPGVKKKLLIIQVISGQQLPKPQGSSSKGEVIDPYVEVKIYGVNSDSADFKTKVIKDNGFNPVWNEEIKKLLYVPELAMLRFCVYDEDVGKDDFIGQFSLPITSLRTGYRHIHLLDIKGEPLPHASLFVHVMLEDASGFKETPTRQRKKR